MTEAELSALTDIVLGGGQLSDTQVYSLLEADPMQLREAAARVTARFAPRRFDSCSIINARSGKCSENCKWCAQSAHYSTGCATYPIVPYEECMEAARLNASHGIMRFSLVTSGRAVHGDDLKAMCRMLRDAKESTGIYTCASMGLLDADEMRQLYDAGVRRYHCNLETAPSHFPTLCTTHTYEDKLRTIAHARALGMDVCCGGIIGMGESRRQRAEFAIAIRQAQPVSIPINILIPIPGTPMQDTPLISDDEIIDTVAIFRMAHPTVTLRFAGGRKRLSREVQLECMRVGINGGLVGDMLTTIGNSVADDKQLTADAGYEF